MQMGLIGLGKMGGNMAERLRKAGHTIVGYDRNPEISDVASLAEMVEKLDKEPQVVWVMVPDKAVDAVVDAIGKALKQGDSVVLTGFGTFSVRERPARAGHNPKTGEPMEIKASKTPVFKARKTLRDAIK